MMQWDLNDTMAFGWMKWHPNNRMTFKWWNDTWMRFIGSDSNDINDLWMNEMTSKWKNDISNDRMTFKWCNDTWMRFLIRNELGMLGWCWNDGMRFKWHEWLLDERNDIQIREWQYIVNIISSMKWHSNEAMTFKWWDDAWMMF